MRASHLILPWIWLLCSCDTRTAPPADLEDYEAGVEVIADTTYISGAPSCAQCRIELTHVVALGTPSDSLFLSLQSHPVRMRNGYAATPLIADAAVGLYDASGRMVRVVGKAGEGPGEFSNPLNVAVGAADTLFVLDPNNLRISVHDSTGEFLYSIPLPNGRVRSVVRDPMGRLLIMGPLGDGLEMGPPLHEIRRDGTIGKAYGSPMGPMRSDQEWRMQRYVSVSPNGTVALAERRRYAIELVTDSGTRTIIRRVPWFAGSDDAVPGPATTAIWLDGAERLWVSITVPDPLYEPDNPAAVTPDDLVGMLDTVVEVIDTREDRVLARRVFDDPVAIEHGIAFTPREDSIGHPFHILSSVRLLTPIEEGDT